MALSFSAVESFYWVSQLRSFNAAADKLNVTQPTVSYRIKELEEQLGVALFVRQKRQLLLTSEGEALKHYAEAMIGIARDIESNIKTRNTRLPTLRVGVMDSFAATCLPALLDELDSRFSGTRVAATIDNSHNLARQLSEGILDVAVLSTPPSHENVALELLGRQTVEWVASPKLIGTNEFVSDSDLLNLRIFSTPAPSNIHSLTTNALGGNSSFGLRLNLCNSISAILTLVEAGTGLSILPARMVQEQVKNKTLQILKTQSRLPKQDVFIGTNKGAVVRALPQVIQMVRKVTVDAAFCG
ncbi:LysR family transcriptional regulator [Neorhizobium sp. JUb45]|uniref:LysR family transcriptional regulator n=1 Tax=unclassified Neorhizobium TaxID=2629175 RepID=UPI00104E8D18|nr:LysR family transcriptional regulator [Neorhizobium sp. JUb45]TCQ95363.1 DNA-binding transcriptional LysR family regulator [Neorhizobium sp. JUb45]